MEDRQGLPKAEADETEDGYEAPEVEDLDGTFGPTVTAAGGPSTPDFAAPRNL